MLKMKDVLIKIIPQYFHFSNTGEDIKEYCSCFINKEMDYLDIGLQQGAEHKQ